MRACVGIVLELRLHHVAHPMTRARSRMATGGLEQLPKSYFRMKILKIFQISRCPVSCQSDYPQHGNPGPR